MNPGPSVDSLVHRLAETPPEFQAHPRTGHSGGVHVDAVVADVLSDHGYAVRGAQLEPFQSQDAEATNYLSLVLIAAWLAHDRWFRENGDFGRAIEEWLVDDVRARARLVAAPLFVSDPDRREELARALLAKLDLVPAGESAKEAADRFTTVDSVSRSRIIEETRAQRERAEKLRVEMERQRAQEAAARYSRE